MCVLNEFNIVFELGRPRLRPGPKAAVCPATREMQLQDASKFPGIVLDLDRERPGRPHPIKRNGFQPCQDRSRPRSTSFSTQVVLPWGGRFIMKPNNIHKFFEMVWKTTDPVFDVGRKCPGRPDPTKHNGFELSQSSFRLRTTPFST